MNKLIKENENTSNPIVSIGIPVYNGETYIRNALESLINQTYSNIEFVISNNASTDETEKICLEYKKIDKRIKYYRQEKNIGAYENLKFVLSKSIGKYFMWAAVDDYRELDSIEFYLKNIKNSSAIFSTYAIKNYKDQSIKVIEVPIINKEFKKRKAIRIFLKRNCVALIYGLFERDKLIECIPRRNFDWLDSFIILKYISKYGYYTFKSDPKFFYGVDGIYKPKPINGNSIKYFEYFFRILPLAIYSGAEGFFWHLNVIRISYKWNKTINKNVIVDYV